MIWSNVFSGELQAMLMQLTPQLLQQLEELVSGGMTLPQAAKSSSSEAGMAGGTASFAGIVPGAVCRRPGTPNWCRPGCAFGKSLRRTQARQRHRRYACPARSSCCRCSPHQRLPFGRCAFADCDRRHGEPAATATGRESVDMGSPAGWRKRMGWCDRRPRDVDGAGRTTVRQAGN